MKTSILVFSLVSSVVLTLSGETGINKKEVFTYDVPDKTPIWFGGESRAENVKGGGRYSIFIDIFYADGTHTWAKQAQFPLGSHDWVRSDTWPMVPGDGIFIYPGKERIISGVRLANVRDGVEDYEWMLMAEKKIGRNALESILRKVVKSSNDFSRDVSLLRRVRRELADAIEKHK